jgi:hypothetical protein
MNLQRPRTVVLILTGAIAVGLVVLGSRFYLHSQKYVCGFHKSNKDGVLIPSFSVKTSLSEAAKARLQSTKEGIEVSVAFDGDGTPEQGVKTAPHREVFLCHSEKRMDHQNVATFSNLTFPLERFNRLSSIDYFVNVNVFSARLSHTNNILDCGFFEEPISTVRSSGVNIQCSLIEESYSAGRK